jgi:hypothetical protein
MTTPAIQGRSALTERVARMSETRCGVSAQKAPGVASRTRATLAVVASPFQMVRIRPASTAG